jgi:hypothetical protein
MICTRSLLPGKEWFLPSLKSHCSRYFFRSSIDGYFSEPHLHECDSFCDLRITELTGQFVRADSPPMKDLVETWMQKGWVAPWKARFGCLPDTHDGESGNEHETSDFFGIPSSGNNKNEDVYIGVGGMHLLPRKILESSKAIVHRGTRVSGVARRKVGNSGDRNDDGNDDVIDEKHVWDVTTTVGAAAFHDTKESVATAELKKAKKEMASGDENPDTGNTTAMTTRVVVHRGFDAVVFTDISSSSDSWHRASAGIPSSFVAKLPPKLRLPLFSCMIALETPLRDRLPFDAFVSKSSSKSPLWFAALSDSKPGFPKGVGGAECWTLVSTPSFAVDEIKETNMRDPVTGAFRPQENDYLNSVPGPALRDAFFDLVGPYLGDSPLPPQTVYLQAQRWGSGLPIDPKKVAPEHTEEVCGTTYASKVKGSVVYSTPPSLTSSSPSQNFVVDDAMGLYYGGDFCSHLNPGFEAAALSGFDLAKHILRHKAVP